MDPCLWRLWLELQHWGAVAIRTNGYQEVEVIKKITGLLSWDQEG